MDEKIAELQRQIDDLKQHRVSQSEIIPGQIKNRHMGEPNSFFLAGLAADRPDGTTVTSGVTYYYATDTDVLYIFDGSSWQSH